MLGSAWLYRNSNDDTETRGDEQLFMQAVSGKDSVDGLTSSLFLGP
jgi:hypothetical protein